MRSKKFIFVFLCIHTISRSGITYEFSGGRMGDNLITYLHAKWIAYKHGLTLLYRPFPNSDKFMLHQYEQAAHNNEPAPQNIIESKPQPSIDKNRYLSLQRNYVAKPKPVAQNTPNQTVPNNEISITKENYRTLHLDDQEIFKIPYFSDYQHEYPEGYFSPESSFTIDWHDEEFKEILRTHIAPAEQLEHIIQPPENTISVAMHVRNGGRYEQRSMKSDQLKYPPNSFFAEQLKYVCQKYPDKKIYAFIFTDSLNPREIADEILDKVKEFDVIIKYRPEDTSDTSYVLDDFFSIPLFNVLIRPCSNFSYVAGRLGNYLLEITPTAYSVDENDVVTITAVDIVEK